MTFLDSASTWHSRGVRFIQRFDGGGELIASADSPYTSQPLVKLYISA